MKVRDGDAFCAAPPEGCHAVLLHGDGGLAAERRDRFAAAFASDADGAPAIERIAADALRRDPAALDERMRARGFFAGRRCVALDGAGDWAVGAIEEALPLADAETLLVVSAPALRQGSKLRKLFEASAHAAAVACYVAPPQAGDIVAALRARGIRSVDAEAEAALSALAAEMDRGAFWRELDKLALYANGDSVTGADVEACGPQTHDGVVEAALDALAARDPGALRTALARLGGRGPGAEAALAQAVRRFRTLIAARALMEAERCGAEAALARLSPPVRWPRSAPLARQLSGWRRAALEHGFATLFAAQAELRRSPVADKQVVAERAMIRTALTGK